MLPTVAGSTGAPNPPATYSQIDLVPLCNAPNGSGSMSGNCNTNYGTAIIGGHAFAYESQLTLEPGVATALSFPGTTCDSITVSFGLADSNRPAGESVTVAVVESSGAPQQATASTALSTLKATLNPGAWALTTTLSGPTHPYLMYIAGTAMCSTDNGR